MTEGGKIYDVVIISSPNVNAGFKLMNNTAYPRIADDYPRTFRVLKSLRWEIFLGAHGDYYGLEDKFAHVVPDRPNVFVDPEGYRLVR